jgi:branched-chain amino acid transport system substrate-binding protein
VRNDVRLYDNKPRHSFKKEEKQLKRKVLLGLLVFSIVASLLFAGCAQQTTPTPTPTPTPAPTPVAKDKIVVGMSRPLSGPLAVIGDSAFRPIYETWVPEVNKQGGVYVAEYGKKLPIELKIYDDKSDVGTMTRLTEKLILEDKVDFLWPACGTSFIFGQAPIANKYGYVLVTAEGGATTLRDSMYALPNLFVSLSFSDWYQVPVLADLLAAKGAKTAYIVYIADLHGIEYSGVAGTEFARVGIKVVGNVAVPGDLKDWAPVINDAKASGADVFFCECYPDGVLNATGTSIALGYNPKAWLGGPGANFGFYHTAFGPTVEGVLCWATWNEKSGPAFKTLADKLYTGKPEDINDWWGQCLYWASVDIWKAAIEKAGTLNQKKIRDVLATEHLNTVLGDTWFTMFGDGGGFLAKECHPGEVGQWINGKCEVVGGKITTASFVYPKPPFPAPAPKK